MESKVEPHSRDTHPDPVTVIVRHRVKRGSEADFEQWLRGITAAMRRFDGQQGYNVVRPVERNRLEYLVFFRFDTVEHLQRWENSAARHEWLQKLGGLTDEAPAREHHTGLEVWFTPPPGLEPPPRWKMAVVTLIAIYPLISVVQLTVVPWMTDWPMFLRTLATSGMLVCLMTYFVMPTVTRAFTRWLYRSRPV